MTMTAERRSDAPDPFEVAKASAMLTGYHVRWAGMHYEVLAVEAEYRTPLTHPTSGFPSAHWQRGGKLDVVLYDRRGRRVVFMEHKSTSDDITPGSVYWRRLYMDGQVSGYFLGADALGFPAEACVYDVLKKPRLRPFTVGKERRADETPEEYRARCADAIADTPGAYYARGEVVRLQAEMADAALDDWETAAILHDTEKLGRYPRNPDACFKWGRPCQFWDVCTGTASIDDPHRFRRSEKANPELEDRPGLPVLSASRLRAARSCLRLHKLQYLDRMYPLVDPEPLRFGALLHRGLEAWWRADGEERLDAALAALRARPQQSHAA